MQKKYPARSMAGKLIMVLISIAVIITTTKCIVQAKDSDGWRPWNKGWFTSVYLGQLTDSELVEFFALDSNYKPSYLLAFAAGKEIYKFNKSLCLEMEGQFARYIGNYTFKYDPDDYPDYPQNKQPTAVQNHSEFNLLFTLRWLTFPWDRYIDTSFAVGEGISYANHIPAVERDLSDEAFNIKHKTSHLLNYLMFEFTFALPDHPSWNLFTRIHHRSGIYGLFNNTETGSNTLALGIRYNFGLSK